MSKPLIIYVSGPYSADTDEKILNNVYTAIHAGLAIRNRGHYPLIPHLYYEFDQVANAKECNFTWQDYMDMDLAFLEKCDALYFIGNSPGADIELARAKELGIPIFFDLSEIGVVRK